MFTIPPQTTFYEGLLRIETAPAAGGQAKAGCDDGSRRSRRRALNQLAGLSEQESWLDEWEQSLSCWWVGLPVPIQAQLGSCVGALALHLGSKLDASWRLAQSALGRSAALQGAAATSGVTPTGATDPRCTWAESTITELDFPAFPDFPMEFVLPPIPRLVPRWLEVSIAAPNGAIVASGTGQHAGQVETRASGMTDALPLAMGAGVGFGAAALFICAYSAYRHASSGRVAIVNSVGSRHKMAGETLG